MRGEIVCVAHEGETIRARARAVLLREQCVVHEATNWTDVLVEVRRREPFVLVVGARLPGADVLAEPRRAGVRGIVMLVGEHDVDDGVRALDAGMDDYVCDAHIERELVPRVRALLRRLAATAVSPLTFDGLSIDVPAHEIRVHDKPVELTAREFDLLLFLASDPRRVFTREELLLHVWRASPGWQSVATVTEHVRRLREKLGPEAGRVRTVRGCGYAFRPEVV